jgi:dephospho-CoA kinase
MFFKGLKRNISLRKTLPSSPQVLGLTGSIGMGKSTLARQFRLLGIPVCDSDALVHRLLAKGGRAVAPVAQLFPETLKEEAIDRKALGSIVFFDARRMKELEAILHPTVQQEQQHFIARYRRRQKPLVVLDIPLLYETSAEKRCHAVTVVTAPFFLQRQRVLRRPGMTKSRFQEILAKQLPDNEKRKRADFVIHSGLGKAYSFRQVKLLVHSLLKAK